VLAWISAVFAPEYGNLLFTATARTVASQFKQYAQLFNCPTIRKKITTNAIWTGKEKVDKTLIVALQAIFKDKMTGGDITLEGQDLGVTRGIPESRLSVRHICNMYRVARKLHTLLYTP